MNDEDEICLCGKVKFLLISIKWFFKRKILLVYKYILWCFGKYCFHKWIRIGNDKVECKRCRKIESRIFPPEHFSCRCVTVSMKDVDDFVSKVNTGEIKSINMDHFV